MLSNWMPMLKKIFLCGTIGVLGLSGSLNAQEAVAPGAELFPANLNETASKEKQAEYLQTFGKAVGQNMRGQFVMLDFSEEEMEIFARAVVSGMTQDEKLGPPSAEVFAYLQARQAQWPAKNAKFLEEISKEKGVQQTASGLRYKIIEAGKSPMPKASSLVTVKYTGSFINGKVFDSTSKLREGQVEFPLNGVIAGWTEGLQKIGKGGKIMLYVPHSLGYGEQGNPGVPPESTLVFEVELLEVKDAPAAAPTFSLPTPSAPEGK